jgi:DUF971 family protein
VNRELKTKNRRLLPHADTHRSAQKTDSRKSTREDRNRCRYYLLRENCPCATCNDERAKKESHPAPNLLSSPLLPMYKPKPRAQAATQVGNYAIQINFTDGHSTGIFSYDYLRTLCPCDDCAKAFRSPAAPSVPQ